MSGDAVGVLRRSLWPFSLLYAAAVGVRNATFRLGLRRVYQLPVPVLSVGNLSVGGTGKTPLVSWLVDALRRRGHRPGVLARGYARAPGAALNDEGLMLAARHPGLPQVHDPDRVAGGRRLCTEHDVDVIVLDDGFQHRRLHRDRDVVCLDAARPFAEWLTLPAGSLREPPRALRRADAVVLTRAERLDEAGFAARRDRIRRCAGRAIPVLRAVHAPRDLLAMPGGDVRPLDELVGAQVGLLSAIGNPQSFAETAAVLGADVVWHEARRDHHRYSPAELERVADAAERRGVRVLVTEKDEAKLGAWSCPRLVLRIDLRFLDAGAEDALLGEAES